MTELKGEKVCRLHRVGISQVHEISIESSSSRTPEITYSRTRGIERKARSVRQENQETEPFKRRRSVVNGGIPDRIEIGFDRRMGR
jgi:hypothetical protein